MLKRKSILLITVLLFWGCGKGKDKTVYDSPAPQINSPDWYKKVVFYQVYPWSFKDSDGDGIGDLKGITDKLDYLQDLGIGGIWINPIYPSPGTDLGYDVSDYEGINPLFGTMDDFDVLLEEAHKRNIKVFMDLVFNHTSKEHPWFKESRSSKDNPKRDWYIWAKEPYFDCKDIPSVGNVFGSIHWTFDPETGEYYFHQFYPDMPDLNFENPDVRTALLDVVKFWLEKGVDGFRLDVAHSYYENRTENLCLHQPETHQFLKDMRNVLDGYQNKAMVGEVFFLPSDVIKYLGNGSDELHMIFDFFLYPALIAGPLLETGEHITKFMAESYLKFPEGGWHAIILGNHDLPRSYALLDGNDNRAKSAVFLQLTLPGTPFIYYGEEVGITNGEQKDNDWRLVARTPMQWNASKNAGFTEAEPWLRLSPNYKTHNVEVESKDPDSLYSFYRKLIRTRNALTALQGEGYEPLPTKKPETLVYVRYDELNNWVLVMVNLSSRKIKVEVEVKDSIISEFRGELRNLLGAETLKIESSVVKFKMKGYGKYIFKP